jgi:hypothetical protein
VTGLYGVGDFGVGAYSTATDIPFAARGAGQGSGHARAQVLPTFRHSAASGSFGGRARFPAILHAGAFRGAGAGLGVHTLDLWAVAPFLPAWGRYGGASWVVLDPGADETLFLRAIGGKGGGRMGARLDMRAVGWRGAVVAASRLHANVQVQAPGWRGSADASGAARPILLQSVHVSPAGGAFGCQLARFPATVRIGVHRAAWGVQGGHWDTDLWAQARVRGSIRFGGRIGPRMLFASAFPPAQNAYAGRFLLSYTWSDLAAPGREPPAPWAGPGIPGGDWAPAPTLADPWSPVPPVATPWNSEPAPASGWTDPE